MRIGVPKESLPGERRVAQSPQNITELLKLGFKVCVERGAGEAASFLDADYERAGATIVDKVEAFGADLVLKVNPPTADEISLMKEGAHLISFLWPAKNKPLVDALAARRVTALAMDAVPRISRAQKLDALSSMANIAGYRAVIEAAHEFGSFFTGQITAAGKVPPAKVLIIGAGVAGLSAIGAARGLGAIVRAFDTRPAVKEQVQSMGAEFLELDLDEDGTGEGGYAKEMSEEFIKAEMELFAAQAREVDIIITTALIPGKRAPILITADMVRSMKEGSVIVDLAAEQGGNCELTVPGERVVAHGVRILGYTDLPSRLPTQSSRLYGNNVVNLLKDMTRGETGYRIDEEDEVVRGALVLRDGVLKWPAPARPPSPTETAKKQEVAPPKPAESAKASRGKVTAIFAVVAAILFAILGQVAPQEFLGHFTVFVLSIFVGFQVVWNVTPALHTPLMSVTNAISGIIVIGALVQVTSDISSPAVWLALIAVLVATINISGGFLVTQRMLNMFRK